MIIVISKPAKAVLALILVGICAGGSFVRASDSESFPAEKDLGFQTVVMPVMWRIPPKGSGRAFPVLLCLKVSNETERTILVDKFDIPIPRLRTFEKREIPVSSGRDYSSSQAAYLFSLQAHHTTYILVDCHLEYQQGALRLHGEDNTGMVWHAEVKSGKYYLSLRYDVEKYEARYFWHIFHQNCWVGTVVTAEVPITITEDGE